jgi:hypothetical protein
MVLMWHCFPAKNSAVLTQEIDILSLGPILSLKVRPSEGCFGPQVFLHPDPNVNSPSGALTPELKGP